MQLLSAMNKTANNMLGCMAESELFMAKAIGVD